VYENIVSEILMLLLNKTLSNEKPCGLFSKIKIWKEKALHAVRMKGFYKQY